MNNNHLDILFSDIAQKHLEKDAAAFKKKFRLNLNSIQNCWTPESRYVLIFGIS